MDWSTTDFATAGALVLGLGLGLGLSLRRSADTTYRLGAAFALVAAGLLVWINLAVGIVGAETDPRNLLFATVLAVAALGSLVARLAPRAMSRAMMATALTQILVGIIVWDGGMPARALTGVFTALWLVSAGLFGKAAARAQR